MKTTVSERTGRQAFTGLFAFVLFALFLILSLLLVTMGVRVYRGVVLSGEADTTLRSALGYAAGKLRAEDAAANASVREINGKNALAIAAEYDGEEYETLIYHMDGALYELFYLKDGEIDPEYGIRLMDIENFSVAETQKGVFTLSATEAGGKTLSLTVAARADTEARS